MTRTDDDPASLQTVSVYVAADFYVAEGVAEGDPISFADELVFDDIYQLATAAEQKPLILQNMADAGRFTVAEASTCGTPGNLVVLDCCVTLMAPDGATLDALVLVEVEGGGMEDVYVLPLTPLKPGLGYRLVGLDRHAATTRLAEIACLSFSKGTHITMASGAQVPVEDLVVGDQILTRDDGPQQIRWIGRTTLRAVGEFAPVRIKQGTLHNTNDLVLSPDHRLFVYQRQDRVGAGRPEVLVKARHLINGRSVVQQDGGFVEYFQLLFDQHQIIFAEGIAAESLHVDPRKRTALPDAARDQGEIGKDGHAHRPHLDYELHEQILSHPDAVALLRRASEG